MSPISSTIQTVRQSAQKVGLGELAREAGVPYTTVKSFADRGWEHKNFEVLERLWCAAERLRERDSASAVVAP
jgi:precorrin-6B methylase 1